MDTICLFIFCYLCRNYGDFTEAYIIAYTEMKIDIIKQIHVFCGNELVFGQIRSCTVSAINIGPV